MSKHKTHDPAGNKYGELVTGVDLKTCLICKQAMATGDYTMYTGYGYVHRRCPVRPRQIGLVQE